MEWILQGALRQHEERIATMLDAHKKEVVDALTQQMARLIVSVPTATNSTPTSPLQPPAVSQGIDARRTASLPSQSGRTKRRATSTEQRLVEPETVSEVSSTLRRGETDAVNWFEAPGPACCANLSGCRFFRDCVAAIYKSRWFEWCISFAILSNAVLIGVSSESSLRADAETTPQEFRIGNACFLALFLAEIIIRWVTEGRHFMKPSNKNFGWNLFDLLLVLSTLVEEVLDALRAPAPNVSFVRLARILRLMRVTRVLRVLKQFKELRIMVHGMLNCGKPLLWASLLLGLLAYMFVVFCLQISSEWLRGLSERYRASDPDYPQAAVDFIFANFGSLRYGMYTLLKCITGGVSWEEIADPLAEISPVLLGAFLLYVLFGLACLLNLITAVFLDAAYERSHSEEVQLLEHIEQKRIWIRGAKAFFHKEFELHFGVGSGSAPASNDGHPEVDLAEFVQVVHAPRVRAWFEEHGLDIYFEDPKSLFELIDMNEDHKLDIHEFVAGLYRLKGGASSLNLQLEIQQILREIKRLEKRAIEPRTQTHSRGSLAQNIEGCQSSGHVGSLGTFSSGLSLATLPEEDLPR